MKRLLVALCLAAVVDVLGMSAVAIGASPAPAAKLELVFASAPDNDLYRMVAAGGA